MKKLLYMLFLISSVSYAQTLSVTPDGLRNPNDPEKTFVVLNLEGKTAKQLFDGSVKYITKNYQNPDKVIKGKIENEYIKFTTHIADFIIIKNSFAKVPITADYTVELNFKDGKVRYEVISLDMYDKSGRYKLHFKGEGAFSGYYIYNNKEELKKPEAKTALENYFNIKIENLLKTLQNPTEDNW
ncbi:DUF4468 domain-containing protein [Flavobacterium sp. LC2016-23]|uniref:DUF4468 domain-containing protein n=1 Tax=Flavobacterium sp. LC2016-23 TaxID=2666330 RepID=UPI0012B004D9|nr:DUF4468 domain-containing protein [Flavobacterium sp. LC2016-23]MRX40567.1 DUF4468 domain-containing protein [Flavobacterium sp. LC2016-23]